MTFDIYSHVFPDMQKDAAAGIPDCNALVQITPVRTAEPVAVAPLSYETE